MKVATTLLRIASHQSRRLVSSKADATRFPFQERLDVLKFPLFPSREDLHLFGKRLIRPPSSPISVGAIIKDTRDENSKENLLKWEKKMRESMGEEAFMAMRKETIDGGGVFHSVMEQFTLGIPSSQIVVPSHVDGYWRSLSKSLKDFSPETTAAVEKMVQHPFLCYRGRIDGLIRYRNQVCLVEWKTSGKPSPTGKFTRKVTDHQLQVAAYIGALNATIFIDDQLERAVVAICYQTGEPAEVQQYGKEELMDFWNQWLIRVHYHWQTYAMAKETAATNGKQS